MTKRLGSLEYAGRELWINPWMGTSSMNWGGLHESRATDSISKSPLYVCFSFVCQTKIHINFVLNFSYSLSFLF